MDKPKKVRQMRSQKFFDIIPPEKYQKRFPTQEGVIKRKGAASRFPVQKIFFLALFILLFGGVLLHFVFPRAEIMIFPEEEAVNLRTNFKVSAETDVPDFPNKTVPGKMLSSEKVVFQEFSSSGKSLKEARAQGIIRVYNAYSSFPQVLIATTRFVSAEGRLFRTPKRVTVPGGTWEKGKLEPGFLDIQVLADQPGEEYNIGPSTFSIPGFVGTPRYTAFYGKSFAVMEGGFTGQVPQITKQDLNEALKKLQERIEREMENIFKNQISDEFILLKEAFQKEESPPVFSAKDGDEGESFMGEMKVLFKAFVFKRSDLENIGKDLLISEISENKALKTDSLKISYTLTAIDPEGGQMTLDVVLAAQIYSKIDTDLLKREISGRSLTESRIILDKKPEVIKAEVKLFPFWLPKIPKDFQKIKIELNLDGSTSSP